MEPRLHRLHSGGVIAGLLRCPRRFALTVWPAATVLYGTVAGLLLHEHPYVAGGVMTLIWLAAAWRLRAS
jgi:hypothetical protein